MNQIGAGSLKIVVSRMHEGIMGYAEEYKIIRLLRYGDPDADVDEFDVKFYEYEKEIERIESLGWLKKRKALKKRYKGMNCFNCIYETVYEGWCCEYDFDEYPYKAHECPLYEGNGDY